MTGWKKEISTARAKDHDLWHCLLQKELQGGQGRDIQPYITPLWKTTRGVLFISTVNVL